MDTIDLLNIEEELIRFGRRLKNAIDKAKNTTGIQLKDGTLLGVGDITGSKESAALKRSALDLKKLLTEKLK